MFFKSFFKVGFITLVSRILGLVRDTTIAVFLGTSACSDAFVIAFKLPNVFRRLFAEGSLNSVFIPIFGDLTNIQNTKEAKRFSSEVFTIMFISLFLLILVMEIFMPWILLVIAPGFSVSYKDEYSLAVVLTRITLPYLFFISLASVYASILNSFKKFTIVAALPFVLNLTIIGFFWFSKIENFGLETVYFGTVGITTAGIVQFLLMFMCVYKLNWNPSFINIFKLTKSTKSFFKRIFPIVITAGVYQVNIFIDLTIASWLYGGAISYLYYGDRLNQLPLAVIGIATSTVIVPFLVSNNSKSEENFKIKSKAILYSILLGLPAVLAFLILGKEIIIMLFNYGKFDSLSVKYTYYVLCFYALGLIPNILIKVVVAIFYAESDGKTPFYVNLFLLVFNAVLAIILSNYIGVTGIALATSTSSTLSVIVLGYILIKKEFIKINQSFLKELFVCTVMTCILFLVVLILKYYFLDNFFNYVSKKIYILSISSLIILICITWIFSLKVIKSQLYYEIVNLFKSKDI